MIYSHLGSVKAISGDFLFEQLAQLVAHQLDVRETSGFKKFPLFFPLRRLDAFKCGASN